MNANGKFVIRYATDIADRPIGAVGHPNPYRAFTAADRPVDTEVRTLTREEYRRIYGV